MNIKAKIQHNNDCIMARHEHDRLDAYLKDFDLEPLRCEICGKEIIDFDSDETCFDCYLEYAD